MQFRASAEVTEPYDVIARAEALNLDELAKRVVGSVQAFSGVTRAHLYCQSRLAAGFVPTDRRVAKGGHASRASGRRRQFLSPLGMSPPRNGLLTARHTVAADREGTVAAPRRRVVLERWHSHYGTASRALTSASSCDSEKVVVTE